jgi:polysaccharide biosynthesis/export protein
MAGGSPQRLQRDLTTLFQHGTVAGLTDRELVGRIATASFDETEALFEVLVSRHGPMVLRVCRNVLHDPHDADDAFQATFLVLVRRIGSIRKLDSIGSWLYGVAARVSARARVEAAKRRTREHERVQLAVVSAPDDEASRGPVVQEEVLRLPERYRSVVVLCYWEGLTHEQAAERLACPIGTVRSRIARARELLRRRLVRRGVGVEDVEVGSAPPILPLSPALVQNTVRASARVTSGQAVSKVVAASVGGLSLQIIRRMVMTKIGMIAAPTCLVLVASIGLGLGAQTTRRTDRDDKIQAERRASAGRRNQPAPEVKEYIVEPPDILRVEVLQALPGRPISGERLVRPDGKVSLGFYGEVYVAGLTIIEIKEKIIGRLQRYLSDDVLGLYEDDEHTKPIEPRSSDRVFIDVVAMNSKTYYVLGDVHKPGKFPITGKETILDAVNLAGGLMPTAEHHSVFLVRRDPQGGSPKKQRIDIDEVLFGDDASTNYYLQAEDRLVVLRDPLSFLDDEEGRPFDERPTITKEPRAAAEKQQADSTTTRPRAMPDLDLKIQDLDRRLKTIEALQHQILEKLDRLP